MLPILLVHGYSAEGKDKSAEDIYGSLPTQLRQRLGAPVVSINLSRWLSLCDGVSLDDASFAMERALRQHHPQLLTTGFHMVVHSTGSLVVRNWIRLYSPQPCPVHSLVHLAGAHFGSGLAHIGRGQLARWGRLLIGNGRGLRILQELEFGSWKTLDLHRFFLQPGNDLHRDYQVREFCLCGSQTLVQLRRLPIRYVKEDSSDNTVRTCSANLNFNYLQIDVQPEALQATPEAVHTLLEARLENRLLPPASHYQVNGDWLAAEKPAVPFAVVYETAHFGEEIGIVDGRRNRSAVLPLVAAALQAEGEDGYRQVARYFQQTHLRTFSRVAARKGEAGWNIQHQYEGHVQLIFRLRDQHGQAVKNFDINFRSAAVAGKVSLEQLIEDKHLNTREQGTITFYLRTWAYREQSGEWEDLLLRIATVYLEISAYEEDSEHIHYLPMSLKWKPATVRRYLQTFCTTVIDVTLLRLPGGQVFRLTPA